ncbi:ALTERED XYLOGLUCAN 9 [Hibiscus trionum]|uniref:ALTERED XYLOGLUCAN 9 n=1 Tax=Hibiscus trionum TaxID=183268 RepID=A0A9W7GRD6_HIBTR|nr:ALTERED XYLOGLUCAN 9 [Hibiscus trionum]
MLMMLGAVQLGVAAACVVVLVPMGMAGWHLSRNKMLFFSGALFISLAICVHLIPYFPSIPDFVTSVSSVVVFEPRTSCINLVNDISWKVNPQNASSRLHNNATHDLDLYDKRWGWSDSHKLKACDFQKLSRPDASDLLNGSWVIVAGDSQARLFALSLLTLVLGSDSQRMDSVRADLFKRHSDYSIFVDEIGMKMDFVWAPYVVNLTNLTTEYKTQNSCPDVMVMGAGLWDMLHFNNASHYELALRMLKTKVVSLLPLSTELAMNEPVVGSSSHLFWLGMPVLINGMLNTEEKRDKMSDAMWHAYDRALGDSKLLRQTGGPLLLLDSQSLTWNCGPHCTSDGMHYDGAIYEAAVQIMLNTLLIESHQRL